MKNLVIALTILLVGIEGASAQDVVRPDFIYKKNNTILEASIDGIFGDVIYYKLFGYPNDVVRKVNLKEVSRVRFANGTVKEVDAGGKLITLEQPGIAESETVLSDTIDTEKEAITEESEAGQEKGQNVLESDHINEGEIVKKPSEIAPAGSAFENNKASDSNYSQKAAYRMISLSAGGEFIYYPGFVNRSWADKELGFALDFVYGGSVRFDFRPVKVVALSVNLGYSSFELDRRFKPEEDLTLETLYSEQQTFTQTSLSGGFKFFLKRGFYMMPEAGISLIKTKTATSTEHPTPDVKENYKNEPIVYGLNAGYELNTKGAVFFDLSLRYQFLQVKDFNVASLSQTYDKPLSSVSFRIGIGFRAK